MVIKFLDCHKNIFSYESYYEKKNDNYVRKIIFNKKTNRYIKFHIQFFGRKISRSAKETVFKISFCSVHLERKLQTLLNAVISSTVYHLTTLLSWRSQKMFISIKFLQDFTISEYQHPRLPSIIITDFLQL